MKTSYWQTIYIGSGKVVLQSWAVCCLEVAGNEQVVYLVNYNSYGGERDDGWIAVVVGGECLDKELNTA